MRLNTITQIAFSALRFGLRWVESGLQLDEYVLSYDGDPPPKMEMIEVKGEETEGRLLLFKEGHICDWLLMEFFTQEEGKPAVWSYVAYGHLWCNMAGDLEPRHTYFGDTGYLYLMDIRLVTQALEIVRQKVMK